MSFATSLSQQLKTGSPPAVAYMVAVALQPTADISQVFATRMPDMRMLYPVNGSTNDWGSHDGPLFKNGLEWPYL